MEDSVGQVGSILVSEDEDWGEILNASDICFQRDETLAPHWQQITAD